MSELTEVHDAFARTFKLVEDLRKDTKCQYRTPFLHQALAGGYSGSVFWRAADPARTIIELRMCALSAALREEAGWKERLRHRPVEVQEAAMALAAEMAAEDREHARTSGLWGKRGYCDEWRLTEVAVEYVLGELEAYAELCDELTGIEVGCFERVWRSDRLVDAALAADLRAMSATLERELQPRPEGALHHLVDPSLYPALYGRSLLQSSDSRPCEPMSPPSLKSPNISTRHAWLPSDFKISADGDHAQLVSPYINGLNPFWHASSYDALCRLVACAVPLWERVLSDLRRPMIKFRIETVLVDAPHHQGLQYDAPCLWVDSSEDAIPEPFVDDDLDEDAELHVENWLEKNPRQLPQALPAYDGALDRIKDGPKVSLKGSTLQVVVEMLEVRPDATKPAFEDTGWHVSGIANDGIVSTFVYVYDLESVTEPRMDFRCAVQVPSHLAYEAPCSFVLYGIPEGGSLCQQFGSDRCAVGRCFAYPNIYQTRLQPFMLVDGAAEGHVKILRLHLVDPGTPLDSATTVCPGQREGYYDALMRSKAWRKLPPELWMKIVEESLGDSTMDAAEAERIREECVQERGKIEADLSRNYFEAPFDVS